MYRNVVDADAKSRNYAGTVLKSSENRLFRNSEYHSEYGVLYQCQVNDLIERGAARKVSQEELQA